MHRVSKLEVFVLITLMLVACMLTLSHSQNGSSISMDSLHYFSGAVNLSQGNGVSIPAFANFIENTTPITLWPPLYPSLISLLCVADKCTSIQLEHQIVWLNLSMLLVSIFIFYRITRNPGSKWAGIIATAMFIMLPSTQIIFMYAWTEVIFIPLTLCSYFFLRSYLTKQSKLSYLIIAVVFSIVATYARYIGIAFSISLLISLVVFSSGTYTTRILLAIKMGILYSIGLFPLLLRNLYHIGGLSGGERGTPTFRLFDDITTLAQLIGRELFSSYHTLTFAAFSCLIIAIILLVKQRNMSKFEGGNVKQNILLPLLWFLIYLTFLLFSRNIQQVDLDGRMLAVAWPFLLILLSDLFSHSRNNMAFKLSILSISIFFVSILYSGVLAHKTILANFDRSKEAGFINGIFYPNINGKRFDIIRSISQHFDLTHNDWLISDIRRPIILSYIFDDPKIKSLPKTNENEIDFKKFENLHGLLLISNQQNNEQLSTRYAGKIKLYHFKTEEGVLQYIAVPLPLL